MSSSLEGAESQQKRAREARALQDLLPETLYTAPMVTFSFVESEHLKVQQTQETSGAEELLKAKREHEQKPGRDRRRDDDGTIMDAPSLKRMDTSVDSDLGSLRDAVKVLVNSRENANRIQTTSGESVIGEDMSENAGISTTDTGFLVEKAEEAANVMQKEESRQNSNETITTESEYKREPLEMVKKSHTSSKKFGRDTRSIKKPLAGSKENPLGKSDLNMATCKTQLSAETVPPLKSSTAAKRKKKGKTTSSEIIASSSSKVTPSNSRETSFQDEPKRKEDRPPSLQRP